MNKLDRIPMAMAILAGLMGVCASQAQTAIPPNYAMPANSVDTTKAGFRVRPYMTDATHGGTLAWAEDQLAGLYGANTADLTGADASGYLTVSTVVNWGATVDTFQTADDFPGIGSSGNNFTEEVITYLEFPDAGTYTMGVNSDDGFGVAASLLNPKDRSAAVSLGKLDGTRSAGDTLFQVSVSQAGIYPFRLVYFQVGGGASVSWFTVITNSTSTNFVLINDLSTPGALKAYAAAKIGPPYAGAFVYSPAGFSFNIYDDVTALVASSLQVTFNGTAVTPAVSKNGTITAVTYASPVILASGGSNTVSVKFADNAQTPNQGSTTFSFVEPNYAVMPASAALPSTAVDTTQSGFLYRVHQIDSGTYGMLAANVAHAEAQLAGLLTDPASGKAYPNAATAGTQSGGAYAISSTINFSYDTSTPEGSFVTGDVAFPGVTGANSDNLAAEIVTYLDLKPGFYNFAVSATDGFRVTTGANPYDAFGTTLGLADERSITTETRFGVAVQTAGIYPVRLVWFRVTKLNHNTGDAGLEFYTVNTDGSKVLVNDTSNAKAVKAYWKRTADYGTFVKYAGPTSFVSPFGSSDDVSFNTVNVVISDGSSVKVDPASVALSIDGTPITASATSANGLTTLSYKPATCQIARLVRTARLAYSDVGGAAHNFTWNFHLLSNHVFPTALYFEDFESTAAGPDPTVPTGWVQENHTDSLAGHQTLDTTDLNSDFYLGWVVVDKSSFNITKDYGVSDTAPQELNGQLFNEDSNPLLVNHYIRAETDVRSGNQIQYLTTPGYDLSGKTGVIIAFDSSYEQNQDNINALEYTVDNGTTWNPILYWMQGPLDSAAPSDIYRDGLGNIDVSATLLGAHGDSAVYTDPVTQKQIGGYYGAFIKAPITPALAPYIEGRINDHSLESKRFEVYRVPLADNQKSVKFRFAQAGTGSWYWAFDNWGIYSVPSLVPALPVTGPTMSVSRSGSTLAITWTGSTGSWQLQKRTDLASGTWQNVGSPTSAGTATDTLSGTQAFYRLISQ